MSAGRLIVWRHGRTQWNHEGRFQGQADLSLDEVGVAQAKAAAPLLAEYRPAVLVSSDLRRTTETMAEFVAITAQPVAYDQDLREIDVGSWAGRSVDEIRAEEPEMSARISGFDPDVRRGGDGETLRELADRAEKGFRRAIDSVPDGQTVLVACHGLATRVGIGQLLGLGPGQWELLGGLDNCGWIVLVPGRTVPWRVHGWNLRAPQSESR